MCLKALTLEMYLACDFSQSDFIKEMILHSHLVFFTETRDSKASETLNSGGSQVETMTFSVDPVWIQDQIAHIIEVINPYHAN